VKFRLLGSLEVVDGGRPVELQGLKQRALLAVLLLHANELVSRDVLIDQIWGERPPATAAHSLDVYVSRLRKALRGDNGAQNVLLTRAGGYLLRLDPDDLDVTRFERLVEEGRRTLAAGAVDEASSLLREALALWRGRPLAELAYEPFAREEVERLEELRLVALEERFQADLALGRHAALIGELEALVAKHPLRERLRRLLMLALYQSGRQADALAVYTEARRLLVDELGIEPTRELQQLQQAILRQDAALDAPPRAAPAAAELPAASGRAGRRNALLAVTVAAAAVAVGVVAVFLTESGRTSGLDTIDADAVGLVAPDGKIEAEVRGDARPTGAAAGGGAVWVAHFNDHTISRIDPSTNAVRDSIPVGAGPSGIAVGGGSVWVANDLDETVSRIDMRTDAVVQTIKVGNGPDDVAFGASAVWVANANDETVSRIDARSGRVTATFAAGGDASAVAFGFGSIWVANGLEGTVTRIDPRSRETIAVVHVGNGPTALAAGARGMWVANSRDDTVSRIDPRRNAVAVTTSVGEGPADVGVGAGGVWVANELDGSVAVLDGRSGRVRRTVAVGGRVPALAATPSGLWVAVAPGGSAHRGGTLSIALPFVDVDSATAYDVFSWQLDTMTSDGLTGFRRVGGSAGAQLVPDLADTLPQPTADGTSYRFRLRPLLRYSTGAAVRASDFRRALERVFALRSPGAGLYAGIVGAAACSARPARCDLARGVVAADGARTITFRLSEPDPELLYKLALPFAFPVPRGTPRARVVQPIPGTGPYMVANVGKRELRLVRNPSFHEWSRAARPDGYADAIVVRLREPSEKEIRAVDADRLDWAALGTSSSQLLGELRVRRAGQTHVNPWNATNFIVMNTRLKPFDDLRVRQAVSYAVDRGAWVALAGGPAAARPTCQILPPGLPGYRPFCLYRGPDLARARRLVAASGTAGTRVTVWTLGPNFVPQGRYIVGVLRQLGYRASLRSVGLATYFRRISDTRNHVQIAFDNWIADYPAPSNFINVLLSCGAFRTASPANNNRAGFCDRNINAEIQQARRLQVTNPPSANKLWGQIEREIMRQAPWVPMINPKLIDFVSRRVGDYQYNPEWGMLIDQLWVR
jgi:YVTN family beta-propeller protein